MIIQIFKNTGEGLGEQGWRSGESARHPPMCPGFGSRTRRHKWAEFVGSLRYSEQFISGYSDFPSPQKPTFDLIWFNVGWIVGSLLSSERFSLDLQSPQLVEHPCPARTIWDSNKVVIGYFAIILYTLESFQTAPIATWVFFLSPALTFSSLVYRLKQSSSSTWCALLWNDSTSRTVQCSSGLSCKTLDRTNLKSEWKQKKFCEKHC